MAAKVFGRAAVLAQITVFAVANNRVAQMRQMASQLVLAPGFGQKLNQAVACGRKFASGHRHFRRRHAAIIGHGRLRAFVIPGKFIGDFVQLLHQRVVQGGGLGQPPTHDRVVALLDLVLFELLRQQTASFAGKSHQQHAGGRPVEAMGGKHMLTNLVANGLHHHHFLVAIQPAAVHQPA